MPAEGRDKKLPFPIHNFQDGLHMVKIEQGAFWIDPYDPICPHGAFLKFLDKAHR